MVGLCVCVLAMGSMDPLSAEESQSPGLSECDQYMEAYVRSSARKLGRALARGQGQLSTWEDEGVWEIARGDERGDPPMRFTKVVEHDGRIAGLVDEQREWRETYVMAQTSSGPVIIAQRWQGRELRESGQECEPVQSEVISPPVVASTVEMEPFKYWGLRVSWRIPSPGSEAFEERSPRDILMDYLADSEDDELESNTDN